MTGKLVELSVVETHLEVEVIISMLSAYAIYAYSPPSKSPFSIMVVDADLEDARALLNVEESSDE